MTVRITGIAGSLRRESFNRKLLHAAAHEMPHGAELTVWDGPRWLFDLFIIAHGTCSVIGATLIPWPHHQGQTRDLPDVLARPGTACWRHEHNHCESRSQQVGQVPSTVPSGRGLDAGRCRRGRARRRGQAVPEETRLHLTSYRHACSRRRDDYGESRKGIDRY